MWNQIMEKAQKENKSIILVTDDVKEDWWKRESGKIIGPQPYLIQEMKKNSNSNFYMYQTDQFLQYATKYFNLETTEQEIQQQINEIQNLRDIKIWVEDHVRNGKIIKGHFKTKKVSFIESLEKDILDNNSSLNLAKKYNPGLSLHEFLRKNLISKLNIHKEMLNYFTIEEFEDYVNDKIQQFIDNPIISDVKMYGWIGEDNKITAEGVKLIFQALSEMDKD